MSNENEYLPDSNYFEIELSFLSKDVQVLLQQVQLFFI
jgi:hypothetical protein